MMSADILLEDLDGFLFRWILLCFEFTREWTKGLVGEDRCSGV